MAGAALLCQLDRSLESLSQNTSSVMRSTILGCGFFVLYEVREITCE